MIEQLASLMSNEPPALVENANGASNVILICEHAGQQIPENIGSLGVDLDTLATHIAWDLGTAALSRMLSSILDAPLILQRYSRLAYDCNRDFGADDAIVERSDGVVIPGNVGLSDAQKRQRYDLVYQPFYRAVSDVIESRVADGQQPVVITVHSFTPVFGGRQRRSIDLGILHGSDARFADRILSITQRQDQYSIARNEPYSGLEDAAHTLITHGVDNQLANVMFEMRNDLIADETSQQHWAQYLAEVIAESLESDFKPLGPTQ